MARKKSTKAKETKNPLDKARLEVQKKFGEDSIKIYSESMRRPSVPTGLMKLDTALGGGVPEGRMIEFLGEPSSGKSTLALAVAANAQKKYPELSVLYIDAEHTLDTVWAEKLGINWKQFHHAEPEFGEDAIFILEAYLKTSQISVAIIDSVAALLPKTEMENDIGDANIGLQARLVASSMRRVNALLNKNPHTVIIFINQKRARIGGGPASFAYEPTKATGGKALPFYMTTRIGLVKIKSLRDDNKKEYGQIVLADVMKNKVNAGPGAKVTFHINNERGLDFAQELLDAKLADGSIIKPDKSSWYEFKETGEKIQGEAAVKEKLWEELKD